MRTFGARGTFLALAAVGACLCARLSAVDAKAEITTPCPVSLTSPDGQGLELEKYDLRVVAYGPLAMTEMEMVFRNPLDRQIEGRLLYLLPTGATVSRFAKEVDGKLMEGEVVEAQKAAMAYREILHEMRDPALLQLDQGNRFSAKVFPIGAKSSVRLLLGFSQLLPMKGNERRLSIPMAGMLRVGDFTFTASLQLLEGEKLTEDAARMFAPREETPRCFRLTHHATEFTPQRDLEIAIQTADGAPRVHTANAGAYRMISIRPEVSVPAEAKIERDWVFYFDTSASGADLEAQRLAAMQALLRSHDFFSNRAHAPRVFAFDLDVEPLEADAAAGTNAALERSLRARHLLGATDLGKALKHLGETARSLEQPQCFVLVSDGIATWGKREITEVVAELGEWPARHVLHALVPGSKQDAKMLNAIVARTHGRVITLPLGASAESRMASVFEDLIAPLGATCEIRGEGAEWIFPQVFTDVRPGTELVCFAGMKEGADAKFSATLTHGSEKREVALNAAQSADLPAYAPLVKRQSVAALLDRMAEQEQQEKEPHKIAASKQRRIEISVTQRVLCVPLTSMIVLEREEDYLRFGIARYGLQDIVMIGEKGLDVHARMPSAKFNELMARQKQEDVTHQKLTAKISFEMKDKPVGEALAEWSKLANIKLAMDENFSKPDNLKKKVTVKAEGATAEAALSGLLSETGGSFTFNGELLNIELHYACNPFCAAPDPETVKHDPTPLESQEPAGDETAMDDGQGELAGVTVQPEEGDGKNAFSVEVFKPTDPETKSAGDEDGAEETKDRTPMPAPETPAHVPPVEEKPAKPAEPEWVTTKAAAPTAQELQDLHAKVQAAPLDREQRNKYANMLAGMGKWDTLLALCFEWQPLDAENTQVFECMGQSASHLKDEKTMLRALSSIAEVAPNSADTLGRAGWLMIVEKKYELAEKLFVMAAQFNPEDPNHTRGRAIAHWLAGEYERAAQAYEEGLSHKYEERYGDAKRVLSEELGYVYRAWLHAAEGNKDTVAGIEARAKKNEVDLKRTDALRVTLNWETDSSDVDLHVVDPNKEECYYEHTQNASGLALYSDQTDGYGPEVIRCEKALPGTYHVGVNYYSPGPMGVSRGVVMIFKPQDGLVNGPAVLPFCLYPNDDKVEKDMRYLTKLTMP